MRVLGLSACCTDAAAVLVEDGRVLAAVQEERFTRRKHDSGFPLAAAAWCLEHGKPDAVVLHQPPPAGTEVPWPGEVLTGERAHSHAASAFLPSPFAEAAVLVLDGEDCALAVGRGTEVEILRRIPLPLGRRYTAFTTYCGFKPNSGEYKLMGLAPYGTPRFADILRQAPDAAPESLYGRPARREGDALEGFHKDVAASIQRVTEEAVLDLARALAQETGLSDLCLGGPVALNCVANGRLLREGPFARVWAQPAAGDAGAALGAALATCYRLSPRERVRGDVLDGGLLGPVFTQAEIEAALRTAGGRFTVPEEPALLAHTVEALDAGKAVGWFQGRMEFGPRALGARSILADARAPDMQRILNVKVKFREGFRPFAPMVPREDAAAWFDLPADSPYMMFIVPVRAELPAVTHVDGSARVQTVDVTTNPRTHALLKAFEARTGCPVLVNTSFNVRGEPIVHTPEDAFRCFMGTDIDMLVIGDCLLRKEDQDPALALDYRHAFPPD